MNSPLVTVVTVTYNLIKNDRRDIFVKMLESVQNQTYKNIEHLVVDGASNDGTVELIKEYADKGWVKFISEPDTGLYDAMNKGAKMAQGKYLIFLNSDDYFSGDEGIEKSVEALERTNADYSYAKSKILDDNGDRATYHPHNETDFSKIFTDMPFCHQTLMVKLAVFKAIGMFDLQYKSAGDYDFLLRLFFKGYKKTYVPYEFVTFQLGGYSCDNSELAINEVSSFYKKYFSAFCKISFEECKAIYLTKHIPLKLLFKLLPLLEKEDRKKLTSFNRKYYKTLLKNFRKRIFRIRLSKQNPAFELFGVKIV